MANNTLGLGDISFPLDLEPNLRIALDELKLRLDDNLKYLLAPETTIASAAYTALETDSVILADATSAAFTVTLPTAVSVNGKILIIKKTDASANAVTVDGAGSETIDGSTTFTLAAQYDFVQIKSDGSNWVIIAQDTDTVTPAGTSTQTILSFTDSGGGAGASTAWLMPMNPSASGAEADALFFLMPFAGTIQKMYAAQKTAPGTGESVVYTLYVNDTITDLVCTVDGTNTTDNDTTNTEAVSAGQNVYLKRVKSASSAATEAWGVTIQVIET